MARKQYLQFVKTNCSLALSQAGDHVDFVSIVIVSFLTQTSFNEKNVLLRVVFQF